jgi:ATP-binding cassette subfamily F protein 3
VGELPSLGGTFRWGHGTSSVYYAQHVASRLPNNELVWDYLRKHADSTLADETILQMAGNFLFREAALEKKIGVLSGGERARLCLASLLLTKSNVLILDEPTNHLDFETVEALAAALGDYAGTVFFISHNRTFVNALATVIIEVKNGSITRYPDSYENYIQSLEATESKTPPTPSAATAPSKEAARQKHEALKSMKKRSQSLENEMEKLTIERDHLLARHAKRPEKFLAADYEMLSRVIQELETAEAAWLEIAEKQS